MAEDGVGASSGPAPGAAAGSRSDGGSSWVGRALPWVLGLGVAARVFSYLAERSLWLDEAMLALNVERRSFAELAGSLDFSQAAPLGFLWLEKLAVTLLGPSELALRFWPLLAGVAALLVFNALAARLMRPPARLLAVGFFSLSASLVYYSTEVKQYAFDVLLAALLMLVALRADRTGEGEAGAAGSGQPAWLLLGVAGTAGVWLSHPLVFVLPGVFLYVWLAEKKRSPDGRAAALVFAAWVVSFAAAYWLTARETSQNPVLARFWTEGFMPLPPRTLAELSWYPAAVAGWIRTTLDFSDTVTPLRMAGIWAGAVLALLGLGRGWRHDRRALLLVALPIGLGLLAATLRVYPFSGRLILFTVPSTLLLIGWGVEAGLAAGGSMATGPAGARASLRALGWAGAAIFGVAAAGVLSDWLRQPRREEMRPVLAQVAARMQPGDVVYLHSGARHAALFYERTCPECRIGAAPVVEGAFLQGRADAIRGELERLPRAGRLWALFSHEWWGFGDLERDRIVAWLAEKGDRLDLISAPGSEAYLFDLGGTGGGAGAGGPADPGNPAGPWDPAGPGDPAAPGIGADSRLELLMTAGLTGRLADVRRLSAVVATEAWEAGHLEEAHWLALRPAYLVLYGPRDVERGLRLAEEVLIDFPRDPARPLSDLVLAEFFVRAGQTDRARALAESWIGGTAVEAPHAPLERLRALLALGSGNPGTAIAGLRAGESRADGCHACADFDLAVAYEASRAADSAMAAYQRYLNGPQPASRSPAAHATPWALRRLGALEEARARAAGSPESDATLLRARDAYERVLALWADADPFLAEEVAAIEERLTRLPRAR